MAKSRSKSSTNWLQRQKSDEYVKRAQAEGYRSRASYKLLEINQRDKILRPGINVVDLGAAPGGWSQVAKKLVGPKGKVFALDILPIESIEGVDIIQGDFTDFDVYDQMVKKLAGEPISLVISDMAPNITGISDIDVPRALYLSEQAFDFANEVLMIGGSFLVKVFQGEGFTEFLARLKRSFTKVVVRKPKASRAESSEVYLLALNFKERGAL